MSNKHLELLHLSQDNCSDTNPSYLLSQGANPNIRDPFYHKWTPLHYAVSLNKEHFVLQLLKHPKTNAKLVDSDGFSPLYWAAKKGSASTIINALLSKGCDPNERDMHGMTALFAAVASNKTENVECLVSHPSINVNQPNQFGGSALHHTAFATDNVEIADALVKAGANLFLFDYEKQTPLHVAKRRKRDKLFRYFKRKMKEEEPSWICDVSMDPQSETSANSADDEEHKQTDVPRSVPHTIKSHSDRSNESAQSSNSHISNSSHSVSSDKDTRIKAKKPAPQSLQPGPSAVHDIPWHTKHEKRMKQVQEKRMQIALKIEQAGLNKEAMELLQEQQIHFQYEHELFYSSLKHEYDKLHYQRDHYMNVSKQYMNWSKQLKHENMKLRMALNAGNVMVARKKTDSKHQKEFKRWFKKQIGTDFMEYYDYFVISGFDDLRTIRYITHEEQLIDLGINKKGHRLHILNKIDSYRLSANRAEVAQPAYPFDASMNADIFPHDEIDGVEGSLET